LQSISKAVQELVGHLVRGVAGWTRATTYSTRAVLPSNRSRFTLAFLTRALDLMIIELSILPLMIEGGDGGIKASDQPSDFLCVVGIPLPKMECRV
jgi:hypothetical protein